MTRPSARAVGMPARRGVSTYGRMGWAALVALAAVVFMATRASSAPTQHVSGVALAVQAAGGSAYPAISADGRFVAFSSAASNLVRGDSNDETDVFVRDRLAQTTARVSVSSSGAQANDFSQATPAISADGRFVAFGSYATNLVAGDTKGTNNGGDVFVRDRLAGTTERVSISSSGAEAEYDSYLTGISADGRFVTFTSDASNLVAGDTNKLTDVFVHDRLAGTTERVSISSSGAQANSYSNGGATSGNGRFVAFTSHASNLVAGDTERCLDNSGEHNCYDVFIYDRVTGTTERMSNSGSGTQARDYTGPVALSADGRFVVFQSLHYTDVFVRDRLTGTTEQVSTSNSGGQPNDDSSGAVISANGRYVAFTSRATNLVTGKTSYRSDVFVRDLLAKTTEQVSISRNGGQPDGANYAASISADGRYVAFTSEATNLVAGEGSVTGNVFVRDRKTGTTTLISAARRLARSPGAAAGIPRTGLLVFSCSECRGSGGLFTLTPDGRRFRPLKGTTGCAGPRWSPDGRALAFGCTRPRGLWLSRSDGSHWRRLSEKGWSPDWSPRGDRVVFSTKGPGLLTTGVKARRPRPLLRLPPTAQPFFGPDWSADGKQIIGWRGYQVPHLWVVDADGSNLRRINPQSLSGQQPRWSPDGRRVAFVDWNAGVRVLVLSTGRVRTIFVASPEDEPMSAEFPWSAAWSPDGHWLAISTVTNYRCDDPVSLCDKTEVWIVSTTTAAQKLILTIPGQNIIEDLDWKA